MSQKPPSTLKLSIFFNFWDRMTPFCIFCFIFNLVGCIFTLCVMREKKRSQSRNQIINVRERVCWTILIETYIEAMILWWPALNNWVYSILYRLYFCLPGTLPADNFIHFKPFYSIGVQRFKIWFCVNTRGS